MIVAKLNIAQKDLIRFQFAEKDLRFNPIQDAANNWIISIEEVNYYKGSEFPFIRGLQRIEFKPKVIPPPRAN